MQDARCGGVVEAGALGVLVWRDEGERWELPGAKGADNTKLNPLASLHLSVPHLIRLVEIVTRVPCVGLGELMSLQMVVHRFELLGIGEYRSAGNSVTVFKQYYPAGIWVCS